MVVVESTVNCKITGISRPLNCEVSYWSAGTIVYKTTYLFGALGGVASALPHQG
jgi:hypothetical protein